MTEAEARDIMHQLISLKVEIESGNIAIAIEWLDAAIRLLSKMGECAAGPS